MNSKMIDGRKVDRDRTYQMVNIGGSGKYMKDIVCPDGCVLFRLSARPLGNENFHKGGFWKEVE